jgi:hypothetical protein
MAPPKGVSKFFFRSGHWAKRLRRGVGEAMLVDRANGRFPRRWLGNGTQGVALETQGDALETQGDALETQGGVPWAGLLCPVRAESN